MKILKEDINNFNKIINNKGIVISTRIPTAMKLSEHMIKRKLNEANKKYYFRAYIANSEKYKNGELFGKWVDFPISERNFKNVLAEIGLDNKAGIYGRSHDWFVTDYDCNLPGFNESDPDLGEQPSFYDLSRYGDVLSDVDKLFAIMEAGGCSLPEAIDIWDDDIKCDFYPGVKTAADLGNAYVQERSGVMNLKHSLIDWFFDYESFGQDISGKSYKTYRDDEAVYLTAGEYYCDDKDATAEEIGKACIREEGFGAVYDVGYPDEYFDFNSFGRTLLKDGFVITEYGAIRIYDEVKSYVFR